MLPERGAVAKSRPQKLLVVVVVKGMGIPIYSFEQEMIYYSIITKKAAQFSPSC